MGCSSHLGNMETKLRYGSQHKVKYICLHVGAGKFENQQGVGILLNKM